MLSKAKKFYDLLEFKAQTMCELDEKRWKGRNKYKYRYAQSKKNNYRNE